MIFFLVWDPKLSVNWSFEGTAPPLGSTHNKLTRKHDSGTAQKTRERGQTLKKENKLVVSKQAC